MTDITPNPDTPEAPAADHPAAEALIAISLNGQPCHAPAGCNLADLLARHPETAAIAPEGLASAVNGSFVARARRPSHRLQAGDAVTVFQAIVGG